MNVNEIIVCVQVARQQYSHIPLAKAAGETHAVIVNFDLNESTL